MTTCYAAARSYLTLGLHPIPADGKRPLVPWKAYQHEPPTADDIDAWWERWPTANVGLVVGRGTLVVDLDGPGAEGLLHNANVALPRDAPRVKTGNGFHVYLSTDEELGDRIGLLTAGGGKPQVDVRGIGFVVAPPSLHASGATYEWIQPWSASPPAAPAALIRLIRTPAVSGPSPNGDSVDWVSIALQGVPQGLRDATCTKLAGFLVGRGLDPKLIVQILEPTFAARCQPPMPMSDVKKCVESIARRHRANGLSEHAGRAVPLRVVLAELQGALQRPPIPPVATSFPSLDILLNGGFAPGDLVYLGARPGVGKTAFGIVVARDVAKRGGGVLFISREMLNLAVARRLLVQDAHIKATRIRGGSFGAGDWLMISSHIDRLSKLPIWLTDDAVSAREIVDLVTQWDESAPLALVIVDYLQLVHAPREIRERRLQVEAISQTLKTLAMQARVPILCLSSLSRPISGEDRRPNLASLRESGELEHDADVVLLLHRTPPEERTECIVAKNRDGRIGIAHLLFRSDFVTFDEGSNRGDPNGGSEAVVQGVDQPPRGHGRDAGR